MAGQCGSCGSSYPAEARFCPACGRSVSRAASDPAFSVPGREDAHRASPPHVAPSFTRRRGILADERILWTGSISVRALLPFVALACVATAFWFGWPSSDSRRSVERAPGAAAPAAPEAAPAEPAAPLSGGSHRWVGLVAIWALLVLYVGYRKLDETYVLTQRRIIHEQGILRRVTNFVEVIDIDDVGLEQTLWERLLGTGSIAVDSSDRSHPLMIMRGIYPAADIATLLDDTRHQERLSRGVHVEML